MTLIYASTFTEALTRLSQAEAGAAIQAAIRIGDDPRGNGLQMHRIESAPDFWSVRVNRDVRIILHKDGERILLAYVDHHEPAYRWAERKRLLRHERTGAMQFVEVPVVAPQREPTASAAAPAAKAAPAILPFASLTDDQMLDHIPRIAAVADQVEANLRSWVQELRRRGVTWARIGQALGITRQSAWERFSGEE